MRAKLLAAAVAATLPVAAFAQADGKYQCSYGDLTRRVEILTEPGVSVPCEVHYYKDSEAPGESQVLWSAQNDGAYCESRTTEFIAKLEGWGWNCGAGTAPAAPMAPAEPEAPVEPVEAVEPVDDTEALAPVDPPKETEN